MRAPRRAGFTLPELLVAAAISGVMLAIGIPPMVDALRQNALRTACHNVAVLFTHAQALATYEHVDVGVKWIASGGDIVFSIYKDGNGNGVLTADIKSGKDKLVAGPYSMRERYPNIRFAFIPGFKGSDPNGDPIKNLADAIKFGAGDICTFSPLGKASPGSVYLSSGPDRQALVRVSPVSSRIQIFDWMPGTKRWVRRW